MNGVISHSRDSIQKGILDDLRKNILSDINDILEGRSDEDIKESINKRFGEYK